MAVRAASAGAPNVHALKLSIDTAEFVKGIAGVECISTGHVNWTRPSFDRGPLLRWGVRPDGSMYGPIPCGDPSVESQMREHDLFEDMPA